MWAPHYYLGELFYSIEQYSDAKVEFEKALEKKPDSESTKYYLSEISRIESGISLPEDLEEVMKMVKNPILLNHVLIEWFENTLRRLIREVLSNEYGVDWWWEGIPGDAREEYGKRSQKCLKEERSLPQLYFLDFDHYKKIIHKNKKNFQSGYAKSGGMGKENRGSGVHSQFNNALSGAISLCGKNF